MILIGKCKDDFDSWLESKDIDSFPVSPVHKIHYDITFLPHFNQLPFSVRYGMYVDFFDSVGLYINIQSESVTESPYWTYTIDYNGLGHDGNNLEYLHRPEAREQAIKKANEIYNHKTITPKQ